jgi:hypothetical protein
VCARALYMHVHMHGQHSHHCQRSSTLKKHCGQQNWSKYDLIYKMILFKCNNDVQWK